MAYYSNSNPRQFGLFHSEMLLGRSSGLIVDKKKGTNGKWSKGSQYLGLHPISHIKKPQMAIFRKQIITKNYPKNLLKNMKKQI